MINKRQPRLIWTRRKFAKYVIFSNVPEIIASQHNVLFFMFKTNNQFTTKPKLNDIAVPYSKNGQQEDNHFDPQYDFKHCFNSKGNNNNKLDQVNCARLKYSDYEQTGGKFVLVGKVWQNSLVEICWVKKFWWKMFSGKFWWESFGRKCLVG